MPRMSAFRRFDGHTDPADSDWRGGVLAGEPAENMRASEHGASARAAAGRTRQLLLRPLRQAHEPGREVLRRLRGQCGLEALSPRRKEFWRRICKSVGVFSECAGWRRQAPRICRRCSICQEQERIRNGSIFSPCRSFAASRPSSRMATRRGPSVITATSLTSTAGSGACGVMAAGRRIFPTSTSNIRRVRTALSGPSLELLAFVWNPATNQWDELGVVFKDAINKLNLFLLSQCVGAE